MRTLYNRYNIDGDLTERILELVRNQDHSQVTEKSQVTHSFPTLDGKQVIDGSSDAPFVIETSIARNNLSQISPDISITEYSHILEGSLSFSKDQLKVLGERLLPYVAFGVLNGGSATSYIDKKKNSSFYPPLFSLIEDQFSLLSPLCKGRAKGLTPAYINPDGSAGYSFLELKMRALLIMEYRAMKNGIEHCEIPMFQMTSDFTHDQTLLSFQGYKGSSLLKDLIQTTGHDITQVYTKKQSLLSAFTPASEGYPRSVFTKAFGEDEHMIALPGGHGQNFYVLKAIYQDLYDQGKRLAYLVNVDNMGNLPSLSHIALTALTGCEGSFEFSYKSPIDIKGGVLVASPDGKLTCKDIGVAISSDEIKAAEDEGKPILFNCATGLFNLSYLTKNIDHIIDNLPLRVSEQNKDAGAYSQAEQVTWEIIDLMKNPIMIAVHKKERFLAAKLLSEAIMTSEAGHIAPKLLEGNSSYKNFCDVSLDLEKGFHSLMSQSYGMSLIDGAWKPLRIEQL